MNILKIFKGWEEKLIAIIMAETIVVGFMQVFYRFILKSSLSWSEELLRFSFEWVVFLAASIAVRENGHVSVSVLVDLLPKTIRRVIAIAGSILCVGFCLAITYYGIDLVKMQIATNQRSTAMEIPMWIPYMGLVAGSFMMAYRFLEQLIQMFCPRRNENGEVKA